MTMPADIRSWRKRRWIWRWCASVGTTAMLTRGIRAWLGRDPPRHCSACGCPRFESQSEAASHAGTHYATIARALLEALDERDEARRRFHA